MQISLFGSTQRFGELADRRHGRDTSRSCATRVSGGVWMSQMPYEPDLLTVLAVALREVDTIEVASGVRADPEPAPDADGAARADAQPDRARAASPWGSA